MGAEHGSDVGTILRTPVWTMQKAVYVALAVTVVFWLLLLSSHTYGTDHSPYAPKAFHPSDWTGSAGASRSLVRAGRLGITDEQQHLLHARPALAVRSRNHSSIVFLKLPDTGYEAPHVTELDRSRRPNPYVVIAYNGTFFGEVWEDQQRLCPVPCFVSSDTAKWGKRADVVVFHAPTMDYELFMRMQKPMGQLWALHSMESDSYYPGQKRGSPMLPFIDIMVSTGHH